MILVVFYLANEVFGRLTRICIDPIFVCFSKRLTDIAQNKIRQFLLGFLEEDFFMKFLQKNIYKKLSSNYAFLKFKPLLRI